jgi:hypothetical protein
MSNAGKFVARVTFEKSLREKWPQKMLVAEMAGLADEKWSMRLRLWTPPDSDGTCMADADFLASEAPVPEAFQSIALTIGRTLVATCVLERIPMVLAGTGLELDFLELDRAHPVRTAA